jgi:glycosyltransferase involved in cell wall biosynthesis
MDIRDYSKYFAIVPNDLSIGELKHLQTYFALLRKVDKPIASLVIPIYRAKETLLAHIISLSNLSTIIPYEVLFIDNNADEITLNILNQLGATVIQQPKQGITYARQKGLECAKGEIMCTMDPDTIYDPSYIDRMVLPFFKEKELVLCYSISKSYEDNFQLGLRMQLRNWIKKTYYQWKLSQGFVTRIKYVRAVAMAVRKNKLIPIGYPTDLKSVGGCDDGLIAAQLNLFGKFKCVNTNIFTALQPPREPTKPYPFCNEKSIPF